MPGLEISQVPSAGATRGAPGHTTTGASPSVSPVSPVVPVSGSPVLVPGSVSPVVVGSVVGPTVVVVGTSPELLVALVVGGVVPVVGPVLSPVASVALSVEVPGSSVQAPSVSAPVRERAVVSGRQSLTASMGPPIHQGRAREGAAGPLRRGNWRHTHRGSTVT